jgi:hypothetical protein
MATRNLGSLTIDLIARTFGFEQGMDRAARTASKKSKDIEKALRAGFSGALAGFTSFTTTLIGGLLSAQQAFDAFMRAIDNADRLDELSNRLGVSTEQLSAWGYAAKLSGSDLESLTGSIQKFSKTVASAADPNSRQAELFGALGISIKDAQGNLRDIEELLPEVADKFKALQNDTTEAALAQELFGRSGAELLEFLNRGSAGLKQMGDEAKELGAVIDGDTAASAARFNDELDKLRVVVNSLFTQLARELLPELTKIVQEMQKSAKEGQALGVTIKEVASAVEGLVGWFQQGSEVGASFQRSMAGLSTISEAVRGSIESIINLDFSGAMSRFKQYGDGVVQFWTNAFGKQADFSGVTATVQGARARNPRGGSNRPETGGPNIALEQSVNRFLAGSEGASKRASSAMSDAQREAQRLLALFDSTKQSLEEQIALFGQTGREAKLRYDIENGELQALNQTQKDYLITLAQRADEQERLKDLQDAADEANRKEQERYRQAVADGKELLETLKFELGLLRMTNTERETAIQLRGLESEAIQAYGSQIAEANRQLAEEYKNVGFVDDLRSDFQGFFSDVISGNKSIKDSFSDMLESIGNMIANRIAQNWVDQLFGEMGQNGGGQFGNWLSGLASIFGGGKAGGGWASPNSIYEVNERGLEMASVNGRDYLLTGDKPVHITPNNRLSSGGVTINQSLVIPGRPDRRTPEQMARESGRAAQRGLARTGRG